MSREIASAVDVILFDLGGVLLELGPSPAPASAFKNGRRFDPGAWFKSEPALGFQARRVRGFAELESTLRARALI